ncbi:hypothetical protein [Bythopirellula goksoeyrii]|uniref:Uncharacterized protein n=1 Tax=Bythopirellula goksoeyrii TaxID=1400387 RepID=A0A5B9Q9G9_9BACT|nr:hypothetical protein [Bythopirellula goksoeyrii]QEG34042.1 hypothetical protein Pr1d_13140 [Bythopirellula goksoeyrii]
MKRAMIVLTAVMVMLAASSAEAGLFKRKNKCCKPATCCQPVCCEATPACYSEPVCPCEAAPAPCGCEAAPAAPCGCSAAAPCGCEVSQCSCECMTRREARKARRAGCCTTCSCSAAPCGCGEVQGCSSCGGAAVEGCSSCGEAAGEIVPEAAPQAPQSDSTT